MLACLCKHSDTLLGGATKFRQANAHLGMYAKMEITVLLLISSIFFFYIQSERATLARGIQHCEGQNETFLPSLNYPRNVIEAYPIGKQGPKNPTLNTR